jgi:hypothetical protein
MKIKYYQVFANGQGGLITDVPNATTEVDRRHCIPRGAVMVDHELTSAADLEQFIKERADHYKKLLNVKEVAIMCCIVNN